MSKVFPDSKVQKVLYHYTHKENVEAILRDGFKKATDLDRRGYTNKFDGVFFTQSDKCYWNNDGMEQIAVRVNLKRPLDVSDLPFDESNYTPEQKKRVQQIEEWLQQGEANHDKIMRARFDAAVLATETTKVLQAAGFDGLIYNSDDGHVEHVVFDPKNIKIIGVNARQFQRGSKKLRSRMLTRQYATEKTLAD